MVGNKACLGGGEAIFDMEGGGVFINKEDDRSPVPRNGNIATAGSRNRNTPVASQFCASGATNRLDLSNIFLMQLNKERVSREESRKERERE